MRTILKLMLAAAVVAATCGTSAADNRGQKEKHQQISPEQQISREELSAKQAMHISGRLGLDEETAALFTEAYCNFQKELWETAPRPGRLRPDADEEETAEYLQNRFAQSRKILELREKYYGIYAEAGDRKVLKALTTGTARARLRDLLRPADILCKIFPQNFVILRPDKLYGYAEHRLL